MSNLADHVRREWDSLRPDDVIYLLAVRPFDDPSMVVNGHSTSADLRESGLLHLRTADVVHLLDENDRVIRNHLGEQPNGHSYRPRLRRLIVNIDPLAYKADEERKAVGKSDVYDTFNVIVRRRGRENNFKRILESIRSLALSEVPLPRWLQEVFLGYGDPMGASYTRLANRLTAVDLQDTFLNWQHLVESLPGKVRRILFIFLLLRSFLLTFHSPSSQPRIMVPVSDPLMS